MTSYFQKLRRNPTLFAALLIATMVLFRLIGVMLTPLNLGPDEAQYWRWSRHLDWGYFSKPPLIAWMIAFTTSILGNAEWAIRFYAPIGHGLAAFFLYLLGGKAFDTRTGAWAAITYMLMPGVWLSSGIISTDGLLLPCWSAALLLLWMQRDKLDWTRAALLGVAIGLAFLAKYAALYLVLGIALAAIVDRSTRKALLSPHSLATIAAAAAIIAPNYFWNAANDFATVSHTADNTNWENAGLNFSHLSKFLTDQMGVFGPIAFLLLIIGLALVAPRTDRDSSVKDRWFLCFVLPPLLIIAVQAVVARAHANWAASAYPAASILVASWALRANWGGFLKANAILHAVLGLAFMAITINIGLADNLGVSSAFKRARGWQETTDSLVAQAKAMNASGLVFDEREVWHGVDYYGRNLADGPQHYLWRRYETPHSFGETTAPVPESSADVFLVASVREDFRPRMRLDFKTFEMVGLLEIPLGPDRTRQLCVYRATGYAPVTRTREYEAAFKDEPKEACGASLNNAP